MFKRLGVLSVVCLMFSIAHAAPHRTGAPAHGPRSTWRLVQQPTLGNCPAIYDYLSARGNGEKPHWIPRHGWSDHQQRKGYAWLPESSMAAASGRVTVWNASAIRDSQQADCATCDKGGHQQGYSAAACATTAEPAGDADADCPVCRVKKVKSKCAVCATAAVDQTHADSSDAAGETESGKTSCSDTHCAACSAHANHCSVAHIEVECPPAMKLMVFRNLQQKEGQSLKSTGTLRSIVCKNLKPGHKYGYGLRGSIPEGQWTINVETVTTHETVPYVPRHFAADGGLVTLHVQAGDRIRLRYEAQEHAAPFMSVPPVPGVNQLAALPPKVVAPLAPLGVAVAQTATPTFTYSIQPVHKSDDGARYKLFAAVEHGAKGFKFPNLSDVDSRDNTPKYIQILANWEDSAIKNHSDVDVTLKFQFKVAGNNEWMDLKEKHVHNRCFVKVDGKNQAAFGLQVWGSDNDIDHHIVQALKEAVSVAAYHSALPNDRLQMLKMTIELKYKQLHANGASEEKLIELKQPIEIVVQ